MTTAQVVKMSVTVNNKNPLQDYDHQDGQTQPTYENDSWVQSFCSFSGSSLTLPFPDLNFVVN